jgi:hypothetical protein
VMGVVVLATLALVVRTVHAPDYSARRQVRSWAAAAAEAKRVLEETRRARQKQQQQTRPPQMQPGAPEAGLELPELPVREPAPTSLQQRKQRPGWPEPESHLAAAAASFSRKEARSRFTAGGSSSGVSARHSSDVGASSLAVAPAFDIDAPFDRRTDGRPGIAQQVLAVAAGASTCDADSKLAGGMTLPPLSAASRHREGSSSGRTLAHKSAGIVVGGGGGLGTGHAGSDRHSSASDADDAASATRSLLRRPAESAPTTHAAASGSSRRGREVATR